MVFSFEKLEIPEVILVTSKPFTDERGFFIESFKNSEFTSNGIKTNTRYRNYLFKERKKLSLDIKKALYQ